MFLIFRYNAKVIRRHTFIARFTINSPSKNFSRDIKNKTCKIDGLSYATYQGMDRHCLQVKHYNFQCTAQLQSIAESIAVFH